MKARTVVIALLIAVVAWMLARGMSELLKAIAVHQDVFFFGSVFLYIVWACLPHRFASLRLALLTLALAAAFRVHPVDLWDALPVYGLTALFLFSIGVNAWPAAHSITDELSDMGWDIIAAVLFALLFLPLASLAIGFSLEAFSFRPGALDLMLVPERALCSFVAFGDEQTRNLVFGLWVTASVIGCLAVLGPSIEQSRTK
jgi:hypothetical protein